MNRHPPQEEAQSGPLESLSLHAKFLVLCEQTQRLEAENDDWNVKKAMASKPRRWKKKRLLTPPGLLPAPALRRGAQPQNSNRLKHGKRTRQMHLMHALVRSHIRTGQALIAWVNAEFLQPEKP